MKSISFWAKNNLVKARILIAFIQLFLITSGIFIGFTLFANDVFIHQFWEIALLTIIIITLVIYPTKKGSNYYFKKACNLSLIYGIASLIIVYSNQLPIKLGIDTLAEVPHQISKEYEAHLIVLKHKSDIVHSPTIEEDININKKPRAKKKDFKRKLKAEIKKMKVGKKRIGLMVLFIVLLALFTLVLGYGMAFLLCELSCSGTIGTTALLLSLFGLGGIIGFGIGIAKINRERRRINREEKEEIE